MSSVYEGEIVPKTKSEIPISPRSPVTIGLVLLVVSISGGAIFKAGQVLTEFEYLKAAVNEIRSEITEIKRLVRNGNASERSHDNDDDHPHSTPTLAEAEGSDSLTR